MSDFYFLPEKSDAFPPPSELTTNGLAVIGSNLKPSTIIKAYKKGYFPWYNEGQPRCWFHPNPRMVLFPEELVISKSMRPFLNGNKFLFKIDNDFQKVIASCRNVIRKYGGGESWITDEITDTYSRLFDKGYAHCAETWQNGKMVGGLYGVRIGDIFFGESMFAKVSNASKFALIRYVNYLHSDGVRLIDCQQQTQHLASLGARPISRKKFVGYLQKLIPENETAWQG